MALVIHQVQGSYTPSRLSWKGVIKRTTRICEVESSAQSHEYKDGVRGSKSGNKSVKLSNIFSDNNIHAHSTSDTDATTGGSLAIHKLFKSWLVVWPLTLTNKDEILESPSSNESVKANHKLHKEGLFKRVWAIFLGIDATIKIPTIMFISLFLIINMKYGANVAKELSPLWIGGPFLIALYIKIVHILCSLYIFSFKHVVKAVKNFTNDQESICAHVWVRVVYFRNLDYKTESKRIWEDFQTWFEDKCLDFVRITVVLSWNGWGLEDG